MPITILATCKEEWRGAWNSQVFRKQVILGLLLVVSIMSFFPLFFQTIEKRAGYPLQDPILAMLPPHNFSVTIFVIIWAITALAVYRAAQIPTIFVTFAWCWILLSVMRLLTITFVALDPPVGLIVLKDPISNFFYGEKFVTRDLFFSGHTSTVFLLFFCLPGRKDKTLALLATISVGVLLMIQHVHYSLDVFCAPLFSWIVYTIVRRYVVPATPVMES